MPKSSSLLWRLAARMGSQKWLLLLALTASLVQVGLTVYLPVLIGRAIDLVVLQDNWAQLLPILLQMLAVVLVNSLIQWGNPLLYNRLVFGLTGDLREAVMAKLYRLPLAYLDRQSAGDLVSRVTTDTEQLSNGLLLVFNQFLVGLLTILLTIISMGQIDGLLMLLVVGLSPLSILLARFMARRSYRLYQDQTRARGEQTELLEEALTQEALLQQFNAQSEMSQRFREANQAYSDFSLGAIFYASSVNPATRFVNALIYALLAGTGGWRIMQGAFTVGQLTTFLNYAVQYTKPFNDISSVFAELQSALACADRLFRILDQEETAVWGQTDLMPEEVAGQIDFSEVSFGYLPGQSLITDLNLSIPPGSRVAIVGPTGAGKSTLINLLMRFYEPDQGTISLDGRPIQDYSQAAFSRLFGLVLQETWLKSGTVHDAIAYGRPQASREEVVAAARAANADFFIRQLPQGYDTQLTEVSGLLSQGQAQLLTIARVFLKAPKILILDEATSSVDTRTELLIQTALDRLMERRTSFVIAHRLSTIQGADLILVMVAGAIVESGTHAELMAREGVYYQMQTAQTAAASGL